MIGTGVSHYWFGSHLREGNQIGQRLRIVTILEAAVAKEKLTMSRVTRHDDDLAPDRGLLAISSSREIFAIEQEINQVR